MIITIPFRTPTVNHLYGRHGNRSYMKPEAKRLREEIREMVPVIDSALLEVPLKVTVFIHEDWYCKNKSVKRVDIANREKFLIDSVFDALGIDDKFIFEHTMHKIQDEKEFAKISIEPL